MLVSEIRTLFGRLRTRALLGGLTVVPVLIALAVRFSGGRHPQNGQGPDFLSQVSSNGVFAGLTGLVVVVPFLLPLAVAVVSGDSIAGESSLGTLRYLLTVPVGRLRLLVVKGCSLAAFCFAGCFAVVSAGLIAGSALFHVGRVTTLSGTTLSLAAGTGRIFVAGGYVAVEAVALGLIGLFVSTLTDTPVAAMAITVVFAVVCQILDAVPQISWLHPYLLTHDWTAFSDLLRDPIDTTNIDHGLLLAVLWGAAGGTAAWARLTTRDILS